MRRTNKVKKAALLMAAVMLTGVFINPAEAFAGTVESADESASAESKAVTAGTVDTDIADTADPADTDPAGTDADPADAATAGTIDTDTANQADADEADPEKSDPAGTDTDPAETDTAESDTADADTEEEQADRTGTDPEDNNQADAWDTETADLTEDSSSVDTLASESGLIGLGASYSLELSYDDYYDLSDLVGTCTITRISNGTITSHQVSGGACTDTTDTAIAEVYDGSTIRASAVGTGSITVQKENGRSAVINLTVSAAVLTVMFITGQSNAQGNCSDSSGYQPEDSIVCEKGQVYSSYTPWNKGAAQSVSGITELGACTEDNYKDFFPSSLGNCKEAVSGSTLVYPLYALTSEGGGKTGIDSSLAYEWNQLSGDKVWTVNFARGGAAIDLLMPESDRGKLTEVMGQEAMQIYEAEIASGHYTEGKKLVFWMQGESDKAMSATVYREKFLQIYDDYKSLFDFDYMGMISVRAHGDFVSQADLAMTGPRITQYMLSLDTSYPDLSVVSNVNEQWVSDSGVASYFNEKYPSGSLTYPLRSSTTLTSLPQTVIEVHSDVHFSQAGHNENGLDAAKNTWRILNGSSASSSQVDFVDASCNKVTSCDVMLSTLLVPIPEDPVLAKKITITEIGSGTYNTQTGWFTASDAGICILAALRNGIPLSTVTINTHDIAAGAVCSGDGIKVTWTSALTPKSVRIYRREQGSSSYSLIGTVSGADYYLDQTGEDRTAYEYVVRFVTSEGLSGLSLPASVTYIAAPQMVSAGASGSGILVKWKSIKGASSYKVYRRSGSGAWTCVATTDTASSLSWLDTSLTAGTKYTYTVRGCCGGSWSCFDSSGVSLTYAAAPSGFTRANTIAGVMISWKKSTGAVRYKVYRKYGSGSWTALGTTTALSFTDKTAESGKIYTYTVRCVDSAGTTFTSSFDANGIQDLYLSAVTSDQLTETDTAAGIVLGWKKVTGATGYYIYRKTDSGSYSRIGTVSSSTLKYTDTTVKNADGTAYTYAVRAYRTYGGATWIGSFSGKRIVRKKTS